MRSDQVEADRVARRIIRGNTLIYKYEWLDDESFVLYTRGQEVSMPLRLTSSGLAVWHRSKWTKIVETDVVSMFGYSPMARFKNMRRK